MVQTPRRMATTAEQASADEVEPVAAESNDDATDSVSRVVAWSALALAIVGLGLGGAAFLRSRRA